MCKVQMLRALVKQRLTAAAEEIFGLFERTIAEYEEQLCRSKEENERQRKLLELRAGPEINTADVRKVSESKEEVPPEQQEWSSSVDQEDPEPPHIKEEEEELWSSQEGEQLQGLEEADITKFTFTPVPVKSEDDEEKPQSEGHHCGGPEPVPGGGVRPLPGDSDPDPDDKTGDSSEVETDDSDDWMETRELQSGLNSVKNDDLPASYSRCSADEKPFSCSECGRTFGKSGYLKRHMRSHTGEKPFSCPMCKMSFGQSGCLKRHMRSHKGEKPFSCSVCEKRFLRRGDLKRHTITHTGEKPFSCSVCSKGFIQKVHLRQHMTRHTGEKLFACSICDQRFTWLYQLRNHQCVGRQSSQVFQTEENRGAEPPANSLTQQRQQMGTEADGEDCGGPEPARNSNPDLQPDTDDKTRDSSELTTKFPLCDVGLNNGKKLFSCAECSKTFGHKTHLREHVRAHTGEKPFSCSVCNKWFSWRTQLQRHMRVHTSEKQQLECL
ncbi:gastrula zinc finger protein XlCGF57.1-like [Epinephelus fuscoguttatus]|uniref:gastrula zinc finger protein XlCGF57.1-like n=1 Tax=Epinephelus fuscoguttatus TaxID=293821 RepID=UPI0020D126F6|nr:gastrula zinc finger protein XlCGF57.1-like [Epinephelus fuscoguttatus]XP_049458542.1 gastrula zinc finger protein XlCGF57.1-like [Epinephelus fuscoguttatus]XP_049458543.1 gastrula zinc finger protein XlCGF57.1-like [Epinephelus fuscoguttatus]XP_049458544.1 gastrula zinc finger protein XlCGF57.1-like [Epinephelus fuscoguttatus]XP_049458545.1 gastrula zinc finger protein XlCGF57.1-like [Epinephelus fuscoguttatus]XP_049458546.1 gastrula zinc finger protein XlCGF57.1-like [Epinephelus fuscogut